MMGEQRLCGGSADAMIVQHMPPHVTGTGAPGGDEGGDPGMATLPLAKLSRRRPPYVSVGGARGSVAGLMEMRMDRVR